MKAREDQGGGFPVTPCSEQAEWKHLVPVLRSSETADGLPLPEWAFFFSLGCRGRREEEEGLYLLVVINGSPSLYGVTRWSRLSLPLPGLIAWSGRIYPEVDVGEIWVCPQVDVFYACGAEGIAIRMTEKNLISFTLFPISFLSSSTFSLIFPKFVLKK